MPDPLRLREHFRECQFPDVATGYEPAKDLTSSGSETIGVKLLQARSFQKVSLRRGSIPAVENDSSCGMKPPPV